MTSLNIIALLTLLIKSEQNTREEFKDFISPFRNPPSLSVILNPKNKPFGFKITMMKSSL